MRSLGLSYDAATTITQKLRQVTAEQVQAVARKYLVDEELTVAVLEPQVPVEEQNVSRLNESEVE